MQRCRPCHEALLSAFQHITSIRASERTTVMNALTSVYGPHQDVGEPSQPQQGQMRQRHGSTQLEVSQLPLGSASDLSDLEDECNDMHTDAQQQQSHFGSQMMVSFLGMCKAERHSADGGTAGSMDIHSAHALLSCYQQCQLHGLTGQQIIWAQALTPVCRQALGLGTYGTDGRRAIEEAFTAAAGAGIGSQIPSQVDVLDILALYSCIGTLTARQFLWKPSTLRLWAMGYQEMLSCVTW